MMPTERDGPVNDAKKGDRDLLKEIAECEALLRTAGPEEKASIYIRMGDVYNRMGKKVKAQIYYTYAMEAGTTDPREVERIAWNLLGSGRSEEAERFVEKNMVHARSAVDKARLLMIGANIDWRKSRYEEARRKGDLALELMRGLKGTDPDVTRIRAESLNIIGSSLWEMGEIDRSYDMYSRSLEAFREIGDQRGIGRMYNNLGLSLMGRGEFKEALGMFTRSFETMRRTDTEDGGGTVLNNIGYIHLYMGDLDEADRNFKECIRICKISGYNKSLSIVQKNLADLHTYRGEPIKARKWAEQAVKEGREMKSLPREIRALVSLAMAMHAEGELEEAGSTARKAVSMVEGLENPDIRAIAYRVLGAIKMDMGDLDEAERLLRISMDVNRSVGDTVVVRSCQLELALVLKAKGDIKGAEKLAEEVRAFFGQWKDHFLIKRLEDHGL